jgi:2-polyprenyl-3-methyl-5-hydroxy-6-metoxy-1,4-benzoquinol methylase
MMWDCENVDVVGDAHTMSKQLPNGHFNVTMSFSVFEHLAMPWKVVLEMNEVMAPNGVASFGHTKAGWRFSLSAWAALFNPATGFRIIDAASAEP